MLFQEFSKNYLDVLMVPSYQYFFVSSRPAWPLIIYLNFNETKPLSLLGSWMCQHYLNMFHLYIFIKNSTCFRIIIAIFYQIIINLFLYDRSLLLFQCLQCPSAFVLNVDGWFGVSSNRFIVLLKYKFQASPSISLLYVCL